MDWTKNITLHFKNIYDIMLNLKDLTDQKITLLHNFDTTIYNTIIIITTLIMFFVIVKKFYDVYNDILLWEDEEERNYDKKISYADIVFATFKRLVWTLISVILMYIFIYILITYSMAGKI